MSYASRARAEIARLPYGDACCALAEAAGMLNAGGVLSLAGGGRQSVHIESDQAPIAHRALSLFRRAFCAQSELSAHRSAALGGETFRVTLKGKDAADALNASGLNALGIEADLPPGLAAKSCCRRAFARGAFLLSGTLGAPEKGYHLEWSFARASCAKQLRAMLTREGIESGVATRKERSIVYLKDAERISDALAMMGAVEALLELENVRVVKELRNKVNRQVNCESANVDKATAAAYRQIAAIEELERRDAFKRLSPALKEAAELRLAHPEATLEELGALFMTPLGKSGVNHRLRRLQTMAAEYRQGEQEGEGQV